MTVVGRRYRVAVNTVCDAAQGNDIVWGDLSWSRAFSQSQSVVTSTR